MLSTPRLNFRSPCSLNKAANRHLAHHQQGHCMLLVVVLVIAVVVRSLQWEPQQFVAELRSAIAKPIHIEIIADHFMPV